MTLLTDGVIAHKRPGILLAFLTDGVIAHKRPGILLAFLTDGEIAHKRPSTCFLSGLLERLIEEARSHMLDEWLDDR
ncbi:hypothetical protein J6TS7_23980 [Paenibacillus dendritiformis]|nr:hypothetical protein J6TS7_23980 [Paenibacillus dendritiformis]